MKRFLCRCVWNLGSTEALGSNCSRSTSPSSGKMVSHHSRHTLSTQDVISMLATDPLQYIDKMLLPNLFLIFYKICFLNVTYISYVGWLLVVLRINVDLAIFQPYLDLEAGDNQSLKIQVVRPGIEPRSSCSASQELNHSATAAPYQLCKAVYYFKILYRYYPLSYFYETITTRWKEILTRCVCKTRCPQRPKKKSKMANFRIKGIAKVTGSLTLVTIERVLLVEYAC